MRAGAVVGDVEVALEDRQLTPFCYGSATDTNRPANGDGIRLRVCHKEKRVSRSANPLNFNVFPKENWQCILALGELERTTCLLRASPSMRAHHQLTLPGFDPPTNWLRVQRRSHSTTRHLIPSENWGESPRSIVELLLRGPGCVLWLPSGLQKESGIAL